jgi:hypothetical protein
MGKKHAILPISLAIAALLDGARPSLVEAVEQLSVVAQQKTDTDSLSIYATRLWGSPMDSFHTKRPDGHRSHYSHRSSRGRSHGNSWHGNSHSNSHGSHYSSRTRPSSNSTLSNTAKRVVWRVIWNDDDDDDNNAYIPNIGGSSSTTSSTVPQQFDQQFVNNAWRYETCWFDDGDLGAPIQLQLRGKNGKWVAVAGASARTRLKRFENVEGSKCTPDRPLSAVTIWMPPEPGSYFLRHYYLGYKGISGFAYEEIINLVVG